jgi:Na+/H+ antiporter NhaD/arsenite permease-like protein
MNDPTASHLLAATTDPISRGLVAAVLVSVFALLTLEKAHRVLVVLGAVSVLWLITYLTPYHLVTFEAAVHHVDMNVLLLLAGMMALVGVFKETGAFDWMITRLLEVAGPRPRLLLALVLWFTGVSSALVDNVTTVIFMTPLVLGAGKRLGLDPRIMLLPMIMAANIGGTGTLVGDPPNIMIGSGANLSFTDFLLHLAAPAILLLVILEAWMRRRYRTALVPRLLRVASNDQGAADGPAPATHVSDPALLKGLLVISAFVLLGFLTHGITGMPAAVPAMVGAGAALVLQDVRYLRTNKASEAERAHGILEILEREIEWPTLAFFAFLFIIVGAAVETGLVGAIAESLRAGIGGIERGFGLTPEGTVLAASLLVLVAAGVLSGLIDNIPFVAVSIPVMHEVIPALPADGAAIWWALALGACLGGNATPVGASANVTVLGVAERGGTHITFREFLQLGVPVTAVSLAVSGVWLALYVMSGMWTAMAVTGGLALVAFVVLRLQTREAA